jgi:LppP/LprE lipoprotein
VLCAALVFLAGAGSAAKDRNLAAALAFVRGKCPGISREISADAWTTGSTFNALYGNCRGADGRDQHIWFFAGNRFVGTDTRDSSRYIIRLWRNEGTIAFMYVLYRRQDGNCCPLGGGKIVRFHWTGERVRALDRIPSGWPGPGR